MYKKLKHGSVLIFLELRTSFFFSLQTIGLLRDPKICADDLDKSACSIKHTPGKRALPFPLVKLENCNIQDL